MSEPTTPAAEISSNLDELIILVIVTLIGISGIYLYTSGRISFILAGQFHVLFLVSNIVIATLSVLRLFLMAREQPGATDATGHQHETQVAPWRYSVLFIPVALWLLGLPNKGFSNDWIKATLGNEQIETTDLQPGEINTSGEVFILGFKELSEAANDSNKREYWSGKMGKVIGLYMSVSADPKEFTLYRLKMNCCAADAVPMRVRIQAPEPVTQFTGRDWVEVTGQITFYKVVGRGEYVAALKLPSAANVVKSTPDNSEYVY
jgi:uncharacterized repeat protein (TIGR03943 family)